MKLIDVLKRGLKYIIHGTPTINVVRTEAKIVYIKPSKTLIDKRIIITGGSRGIGYAMAKKFIAEEAKVLIAGRDEASLRNSAEELGCEYLCLDVNQVDKFDNFIQSAVSILGGIDCLVNNAGISLHENSIFDVSEKQFDAQFNTNLKGAFFLTQAFMNYCRREEQDETKNILFTSSETGSTVDERPYGLTKTALNSLVQGLAHKYANEGYRINAIAPGVTISDMIGVKTDNLTCDYNLTKRYYLPEEVAEVASFLLSDASNCLNGQILECNEGKTINARWK